MHRAAGFIFTDDSTGLDQVGSGAAVVPPVKPRLVRRRYSRHSRWNIAAGCGVISRCHFFRRQGCHHADRLEPAYATHRSTG